jgi:hypothetical protein
MKTLSFAIALLAAGGIFLTASAQQAADATSVQNAVLEGVNFSVEKGATADEQIVTCYFIFKDKPSAYFYNKVRNAKTKEKKIVFEFNDTEMGASPINYESSPPITTFKIDKERFNSNAEVQGLTPEWHDKMIISFSVSNLPAELSVSDQFNIISFSYKWSTDPAKAPQYTEKESKLKAWPFVIGGAVLGAGGIIVARLVSPLPPPPSNLPLSTDDLPRRPNQ